MPKRDDKRKADEDRDVAAKPIAPAPKKAKASPAPANAKSKQVSKVKKRTVREEKKQHVHFLCSLFDVVLSNSLSLSLVLFFDILSSQPSK